MATTRAKRQEIVNESISRWEDMEVSELVTELHELEVKEETFSGELSVIRELKRALKSIIDNRSCEGYFDDMYD